MTEADEGRIVAILTQEAYEQKVNNFIKITNSHYPTTTKATLPENYKTNTKTE
jgi:hypothetical protein